MTDYVAERAGEIEALQAMYSDEELHVAEDQKGFTITISSDREVDGELLSVDMELMYTPRYPDEPPLIAFSATSGMDESTERELQEFVMQCAEDSVGAVMGFTLISSLTMRVEELVDEVSRQEAEEERKREAEEKASEEARFRGTPVTKETFLEWRMGFEAEEAGKRKAEVDPTSGKMTGKQMFEKDASLAKSDAGLLDDD